MKKAPAILAVGFVLITFFRVQQFLRDGMHLGTLGISFAIALTCAVYSAAYFTQFKETKFWAIVALVMFGALDLWFNELEMIRSLSPETLVVAGSSFLAMNSEQITKAMHVSALIYGVAPTLCSALLGFLQGDVEKVQSLNKRGVFGQVWYAIRATFLKGLNATLAEWFGQEYLAPQLPSKQNQLPQTTDGEIVVAKKVRWEDLLADDKDAIAQMNTRQIMSKYAVSKRTASYWKQKVGK